MEAAEMNLGNKKNTKDQESYEEEYSHIQNVINSMLPLAQKQNERESNFATKTQVLKTKNSEKPITVNTTKKRNVKNLYYNTNEDGKDEEAVNGGAIIDHADLINTVEQENDGENEEDDHQQSKPHLPGGARVAAGRGNGQYLLQSHFQISGNNGRQKSTKINQNLQEDDEADGNFGPSLFNPDFVRRGDKLAGTQQLG